MVKDLTDDMNIKYICDDQAIYLIKLDYDQIFIKHHLAGSQLDHLCNSQCQGGDQHAPADLGAWAEGGEEGGGGGESGILEKVHISTGIWNHARYWCRPYWTGEQ